MHVRTAIAITLALLATAGTATAQGSAAAELQTQPAPTIAQAYGIDGWSQIERIDFTFNVQRPGRAEPMSRQWSWWPNDTAVRLEKEGQEPIEYRRNELPRMRLPSDHPIIQADRQFINDSYWLLFPFQIVWSNPEVSYEGEAPLPMGDTDAPKITVQYPEEGGYTPGDAYDLYLDENHRIQQWVFRRGGKPDGSAMTWSQHRQLGPIVVSLEHEGPANAQGERFRLWFSDVRAELVNADQAVTPQPMGDGE